jgi:hypothetical protein
MTASTLSPKHARTVTARHRRHASHRGPRAARIGLLAGLLLALLLPLSAGAYGSAPVTSWHYAPNGDFKGTTYLPGRAGFDLADVSGAWRLPYLPKGVEALVWVGSCNGADSRFVSTVTPFLANSKVFGYYLMDEPDPTGRYNALCPPANLKAESDWIHSHDPGKKTFIISMNLSSSRTPSYAGSYNPANSDIDLYGIDPYPCRTEVHGCAYSYIGADVTAAERAGIPNADIVPVYQAFGGGAWTDDGGGRYQLPTAAQETLILNTWAGLVAAPAFDYAYSWGSQNGDTALSGSPALQQVFAAHNAPTP